MLENQCSRQIVCGLIALGLIAVALNVSTKRRHLVSDDGYYFRYLKAWSDLAESLRTDQAINNYGHEMFVDCQVGQRAINNYRCYIGVQMQCNVNVTTYLGMDNIYVVDSQHLAATIANHWVGARSNLITGCDLTQTDDLGWKLTTSEPSVSEPNVFAAYLMQPRKPSTGSNLAKQLKTWVGEHSDERKENLYPVGKF